MDDTVAVWNAEAYRLRHSDPAQARFWAARAQAEARNLGDRAGEGRALFLDTLCRYIQGDLEGVATDLAECLRLMETPGARLHRAEVLNLWGNLADRLGRTDEAVLRYREALAVYTEVRDASGISMVLNNLALVHRASGRWSEALEAALESLSWCDRSAPPGQSSYALGTVAQILFDLDLVDAALSWIRRALAAWSEGGDESHRGTLKVLLGDCLGRLGDPAGALPQVLGGLNIARRTKNRNDEARALRALGRLLHHTEDYLRAEAFLLRARRIAVETSDPEAEREVLTALGENLALRGRWEEARTALERALGLGTPAVRGGAEVHRLLSRVEEGRGDFEAALRHLQTHQGILQRMRHDEARARLAEIGHRDRLRQAREEADRLRSLALTDPLTGVANRGHLDRRLEEEFDRARRFGRPLALLMVDLDGFKQVNDELSHQTGDAVLAAVARILRDNCRQEDLVGRYGGDEFQVVLVETTEDQARKVARTLIQALEAYPWSTLHPRLVRQAAGIGVAGNQDCLSATDLVARADAELYREKRLSGRLPVASRPHLA